MPGDEPPSGARSPRVATTVGEAAPREPALDPTALQSLRDLEAAAEPGLLREILETFRNTGFEKIEAMRLAAREGKHGMLEQAAHSLKGSCGMVGAHRMAEGCLSVEEAAGQGTCRLQGLAAVGAEWSCVLEEIEALLRTMP